MTHLVLGTRGSRLALAQSEMMAAALRAAHPGLSVSLTTITTQGDRVLDVALSAVGDKGLFVKELEQALLDRSVDLCVHSCKDLPALVPDGLTLAAFPQRADARDLLVINADSALHQADPALSGLDVLPHGAVVGTSSLRRGAQLRALRPDLQIRDVRGNVDTRLRKLASGQYHALVLAAAGVDRLGLIDANDQLTCDDARFVAYRIATTAMLPAVAQGILAIECRSDDATTLGLLAALDHAPSRAMAEAERGLLARLEGGCQVPIAAHATISGDTLSLHGMVASLDGTLVVRSERSGSCAEASAIGVALAETLLAGGAEAILNDLATARQ